MATDEEIFVKVTQLKKRYFSFYAIVLTMIPAIILGVKIFGSRSVEYITAIWLIAIIISYQLILFSKCPNCGEHFWGWKHSIYYNKYSECNSCGLSLKIKKAG
jgi:hypothetical protein